MTEKELTFIIWALAAQGLFASRTESGFWVIRNWKGQTATFLLPEAGIREWHLAMLDLAQRGIITWPPDW